METADDYHQAIHTSLVRMPDNVFSMLSRFIYSECGIKMPPAKKTMLEARLQKRLRRLNLSSFQEYADFLFSNTGMQDELVHMIDVVTTNKTDFFREPAHFSFLAQHVLPEFVGAQQGAIMRRLSVWSAGCSTGEEPYTLAMVLSEFARVNQGFSYVILATDISTRVLATAKDAVYPEDSADAVPDELRRKYLLKSKDRTKKLVRIVPELRESVRFRRLNFMEGDFGMREPMDIIFCRNVIIYFDRPTQERLLQRFCGHLRMGGHVFMGHSETLNGLDVPLVQVAPTVYRKDR